MKEYRIDCEECESSTEVFAYENSKPEFCPMCGRRADVENRRDELDGDLLLEDLDD